MADKTELLRCLVSIQVEIPALQSELDRMQALINDTIAHCQLTNQTTAAAAKPSTEWADLCKANFEATAVPTTTTAATAAEDSAAKTKCAAVPQEERWTDVKNPKKEAQKRKEAKFLANQKRWMEKQMRKQANGTQLVQFVNSAFAAAQQVPKPTVAAQQKQTAPAPPAPAAPAAPAAPVQVQVAAPKVAPAASTDDATTTTNKKKKNKKKKSKANKSKEGSN